MKKYDKTGATDQNIEMLYEWKNNIFHTLIAIKLRTKLQ